MKKKSRIYKAIMLSALMIVMAAAPAYGASVDDILSPLKAIKTLFTAAISVVGGILAAKNAFELYTTFQQQDQHGMSMALKGLIGSVFLTAIGAVLTFLGL